MNDEQKIPEEQSTENSLQPEKMNENTPLETSIEETSKGNESTNQQPEINDMEIHHHPDTHNKKRWKEYLFEFLMLFLAVTSGFFVENQREHYIESKREKEYAKSLYDDLRTDTFTIQRTYNEKDWAQKNLDSLENILSSSNIIQNNELIYYFERFIMLNDIFTTQDVTYQQLRSSGNFRYIKNNELYKKIAAYYNMCDRYRAIDNSFFPSNDFLEFKAKFFNASDLKSLYNPEPTNFLDLIKRPERKFQPITIDKEKLNFLTLKISSTIWSIMNSKYFLGILQSKALEVIIDLKKEYYLK
jgi:hypothetical protein